MFSACYILNIPPQRGEGENWEGVQNFKSKHTEPLTQEITWPLYIASSSLSFESHFEFLLVHKKNFSSQDHSIKHKLDFIFTIFTSFTELLFFYHSETEFFYLYRFTGMPNSCLESAKLFWYWICHTRLPDTMEGQKYHKTWIFPSLDGISKIWWFWIFPLRRPYRANRHSRMSETPIHIDKFRQHKQNWVI